MNLRFYAFAIVLSTVFQIADAQEWMKIHRHYDGVDWIIPIQTDKYSEYDFDTRNNKLNVHAIIEDERNMAVPFSIENIDSIDFASSLTDEEKGHNKYRPFTMHITTDGLANIVEKEVWLNCHIAIDGKGEYSDFSGTGRIRGRGNSSWEWYDKKPYKFKLDEKSKLLGMEKAKNWNLLANYRDVTDMMNVYAFETARYMKMPHTNHSRFVEVFLNEKYIGTYQLTEKIEVGKNRVDIDEEKGIMLSFDQDDGPELSPNATDNFTSAIYNLPMCVKHPDNPDAETVQKAKEDFAELEKAIMSNKYQTVDSLLDIHSFIGILQLHEFLYNVEIDAPRSIYMYRDKDGKYVFGPVWDWDAGYDFDWGTMYNGHTFFTDYKELIYGNDPVKGSGASYRINNFWRDLFKNKAFVTKYKEQWESIKDSVFTAPWDETQKYIDAMNAEGTYDRDTKTWPLVTTTTGWGWGGATSTTHYPDKEITKMQTWLKKRKNYLDTIINNYPAGNDETAEENPDEIKEPKVTQNNDGSITVDVVLSADKGYNQDFRIMIDKSLVTSILGSEPTSLRPINADGSEGRNTAAGTYGAWFDDYGTQDWSFAHVYIESDDLYIWKYGCHPDNCGADDKHTVRMQYKTKSKKLIVTINFTVQ